MGTCYDFHALEMRYPTMTKNRVLAEHTGLEPILTVSKTVVLPLHQCSI